MPPPLLADWEPIRATAVSTGSLRTAADRHGVSYDAVKQRAHREAWPVGRRIITAVRDAKQAADQQLATLNRSNRVTPVTTTDALTLEHVENGHTSRLLASRLARQSLERSQPVPVESAADLHSVVKSLGLLHGWNDSSQQPDVAIQINVG
jgi:hypothetical protein